MCQRLVGLQGSAKDLVGFELQVGADWSCLMGVGLAVSSEFQFVRFLAADKPPLLAVTPALPFGSWRRLLLACPFLVAHSVDQPIAVGAPAPA